MYNIDVTHLLVHTLLEVHPWAPSQVTMSARCKPCDHGHKVSDHGLKVSDHGHKVSDHGHKVSDHSHKVSEYCQ